MTDTFFNKKIDGEIKSNIFCNNEIINYPIISKKEENK